MTEAEQKQIDDLKREVEGIKKIVGSLKFPLDVASKGAIEGAFFQKLFASKFYGGLPVYTSARTGQNEGEVYLTNITGTRRICGYISGVEYCVAIT